MFQALPETGWSVGRIMDLRRLRHLLSESTKTNFEIVDVFNPDVYEEMKAARDRWFDQSDDEFYYHVTTAEAAEEIMRNGLRPGHTNGSGFYADYSRGKVFFCQRDGVSFWMDNIAGREPETDFEEDENIEKSVAVVRFPKSAVPNPQIDTAGSHDSRTAGFYTTTPIV